MSEGGKGSKEKRSPPGTKQSPLKKMRRTLKPSFEDEVLDDVAAAQGVHGITHSEFSEPFDLELISDSLKEWMVKLTPVLLGRSAAYNESFFVNVVGLCPRGLSLNKLPVTHDSDILAKWPPKCGRYEIADCIDPADATLFCSQWFKVYGETPDNNYFSLKFLRGCYYTFVLKQDVNWVEEALDRRRLREGHVSRNPKMLGAVALRQQIQALCDLIRDVEVDDGEGSLPLKAAKSRLRKCEAQEQKALKKERTLVSKLESAKKKLADFDLDSAEEDLTTRFSKASKEAKSLQRQGKAGDAQAKKAEAVALLVQINEASEKTEELEDAIRELEEALLPQARVELETTRQSLVEAKEKINLLSLCPGCQKSKLGAVPEHADVGGSSE